MHRLKHGSVAGHEVFRIFRVDERPTECRKDRLDVRRLSVFHWLIHRMVVLGAVDVPTLDQDELRSYVLRQQGCTSSYLVVLDVSLSSPRQIHAANEHPFIGKHPRCSRRWSGQKLGSDGIMVAVVHQVIDGVALAHYFFLNNVLGVAVHALLTTE